MDWELICYILEKFQIRTRRKSSFNSASKLLLLDENAVDIPGNLYVTAESAAPDFRFALVVAVGPCATGADNCIELAGGSVSAVHNALADAKNYLDTLESVLTQLDSDQEILDAAGMYLNCPMFYFDESYRVLAITRDVTFVADQEWFHMQEKGFLSPEKALEMKENGDLDMLAEAERPVVYKSDIFPFVSIVLNIIDGGFVGRINMLCIRGDTSPLAQRACELVGAQLKRNLLRSRKKPVGGPVRSMLMDLLRGVELPETLISGRLKLLPDWDKGVFRIFCVDLDMERDKQVGPYYSRLLEGLGLNERLIPLVYENQLVSVLHAPDEETLELLTSKLADFFQAQHLYGGVSNSFRWLGALWNYYDQALSAREMGEPRQLNFYRDYMLERILSYIPTERLDCLISPDIARLEEADAQYSLSLTETLKTYLSCGCRLVNTANALFVHKNTLLYRLNRIRSILQCDLEDADARMLLGISFKLLEARTKK